MVKKKKISKNNSQIVFISLLIFILISTLTLIKLVIDNSKIKQNNITVTNYKDESTMMENDEISIFDSTISVDEGIPSITGPGGESLPIDIELLKKDGFLPLLEIDTASTQDVEKIDPKNVYTEVCGYLDQKPEDIYLTCADGGILVRNIKWDIWRASGAKGTGIHSVNQCDPDCANGKRLEYPVEVRLSKLMTDGEKFYLTSFNAYSLDGQVLDMGWTYPWEEGVLLLTEDGSIASFLD
jgi:hypothetical protein